MSRAVGEDAIARRREVADMLRASRQLLSEDM